MIDAQLAGSGLTADERSKLEAEKATRQDQLTQLEAVLPPKDEWEAKLAAIRQNRLRCRTPSTNITRWRSWPKLSNSRMTARLSPAGQ